MRISGISKTMKGDLQVIISNKLICLVYSSLLILLISNPVHSQLNVSENGRHLVDVNGTPFFWLGDTGWALFQKLNREEVAFYFESRAQQGFSVIHAAAFNINPFVLPPVSNVYGDLPFLNNDPLQPIVTPGNNPGDSLAYDYWDHVEYVINTANKYGLYINLLPVFGVSEGEGYNLISPKNAYEYGRFIGRRYKDKKNIIWCMGGDVLADNELRKSVWNLLAKGITEGVTGTEDYDKTLMTYHVRGGHSSSEYFSDALWLDFHMLQTWASFTSIYDAVTKDYNREPVKPILHGEGAYEDGPEYPTKPITPHIIRKQAYWAIFAGGSHTYGNSNVWNFGTNPYYVSQDWKDAIRSEGSNNLSICRAFFESLEWWDFIPDQSIIIEGAGSGDSLNVAMRSFKGNTIIVYFSNSTSAIIDFKEFKNTESFVAIWIDPKTGEKYEIGDFVNIETKTFSTPDGWKDALLLIQEKN
jgi:hypothetical protein